MNEYHAFLSRAGAGMQGSAIRKVGALMAGVPDLVSLAPGYPDPEVFAWEAFRDIAAAALSGLDGRTLQYGPTRGFAPLLDALPDILATRGIVSEPDELLVTTGSQQGLDLVARVLCDPGDVLFVELPTFTGATAAFRDAGVVLEGVRQEHDGIDIESLSEAVRAARLAGRRANCVYVVPNFQNPTGLLMSLEKRRRLLELAAREHLLIIEDDPYGDLYFGDDEAALTRPIKADDRDGRVVYLSSFSKTLAPGFRVAWMTAPSFLASRFDAAKQAADLCTGSLDQRIVFEAWRRGVLTERLPLLRAHYRAKLAAMTEAIQEHFGDRLNWQAPRGGFFLWATLPDGLSGEALLPRAIRAGVAYVAGAPFFVDGSGARCVRLCYSWPTADRITEGIARFGRVVGEALAERRT